MKFMVLRRLADFPRTERATADDAAADHDRLETGSEQEVM